MMNDRFLFPQTRIPNLDFPFALVAATGGQAFAVGAKGQAPNRPGESAQLLDLGERLPIPDPDDNLSPARCGEVLAIRAEGDAHNEVGVSGKGVDPFACSRIPELYFIVAIPGGQKLPRWVERNANHARQVPPEGDLFAAVRVPDYRGHMRADRGEVLSVSAECHTSDMFRVGVKAAIEFLAVLSVPELHQLHRASGNGAAVGTKRHATNHSLEIVEGVKYLAAFSVPKLCGLVV